MSFRRPGLRLSSPDTRQVGAADLYHTRCGWVDPFFLQEYPGIHLCFGGDIIPPGPGSFRLESSSEGETSHGTGQSTGEEVYTTSSGKKNPQASPLELHPGKALPAYPFLIESRISGDPSSPGKDPPSNQQLRKHHGRVSIMKKKAIINLGVLLAWDIRYFTLRTHGLLCLGDGVISTSMGPRCHSPQMAAPECTGLCGFHQPLRDIPVMSA